MITVWFVVRNASTSGFVISPRNTVGGFIARHLYRKRRWTEETL
jgi:hypothetical protein